MTRERTKRKREEETKENRNIRRFQKPSAVISMTKPPPKKTVAANVVHIRTCTYACTTVLISLTANFVNNLLFMTKVRQYLKVG